LSKSVSAKYRVLMLCKSARIRSGALNWVGTFQNCINCT